MPTVHAAPAAAILAFACSACASDSARVGRHWESETWSGAFEAMGEHPEQAVPAYALAVATPAAFLVDDELTHDGPHDRQEDAVAGDWLSLGLGLGAIGFGGVEWIDGDEGRSFEVALESIGATSLLTTLLKNGVGRRRPGNSKSTASFPSGHTSFAFAGATFLARRIQDEYGGGRWGYLLYAPALYVGFSRVDANRHFPSDVAAGALIGVVLTNWIYDAHYGEEGNEGIYGAPDRTAWSFGFVPTDSGVALGVHCGF